MFIIQHKLITVEESIGPREVFISCDAKPMSKAKCHVPSDLCWSLKRPVISGAFSEHLKDVEQESFALTCDCN